MVKKQNQCHEQNYKSANLDKLHSIQLNLLSKFALFCDKHDLTYFLCGGTLLGAIRHHGFIPWDDDIDVFMPRPDYEQLLTLLEKKRIDDYTQILSPFSGVANFPFTKIYDTRYEVIEDNKQKMRTKEYVWIDVFPIDGLPSSIRKSRFLYTTISIWKKILATKLFDPSVRHKSISKKTAKTLLQKLIILSPDYCLRKINHLAKKCDYSMSNYVGCVVWGYGIRERMKKSDFGKKIKVEFNGKKFYTFSGYKQYLRNLYGENYMELPPEKDRRTHSILIREDVEKSIDEK